MTLLYIIITSLYFIVSISGFILARILGDDKFEFNVHLVVSILLFVFMAYSILGGN
ncbi:hypothetical protein Glittering_48 [Bacillus phage Glittering]|uniref:Uncharacterized protein n=1 Tax=Bacillus phage Glittering TaxID=2884421 RepID=U5PTF0_9CAUD|nr:hypothetical protein Glittering_48 [Bacillus phage Glittering]AGY47235.1 hypothetical protein Glittering_48 [Bacillus phage Glittering]